MIHPYLVSSRLNDDVSTMMTRMASYVSFTATPAATSVHLTSTRPAHRPRLPQPLRLPPSSTLSRSLLGFSSPWNWVRAQLRFHLLAIYPNPLRSLDKKPLLRPTRHQEGRPPCTSKHWLRCRPPSYDSVGLVLTRSFEPRRMPPARTCKGLPDTCKGLACQKTGRWGFTRGLSWASMSTSAATSAATSAGLLSFMS